MSAYQPVSKAERVETGANGAYRLIERLSAHQNREVFRAEAADETSVIVKRLSLGQVQDWKALELFEREARTLQAFCHPRVPKLLDYLCASDDKGTVLTQVMEWIPGPSLAMRLQAGWRPAEAEVLDIARQALEILRALHGHKVPLVHRDLKPSNLIWTDAGELYLIDFGAVRDIFLQKGASTVIGTFGYMAPEQFMGQCGPESDLYGLGATLVHLLTGRPPSELPQQNLKLDFRPFVSCSDGLQRWLAQLLEPEACHRPPDAQSALAALTALTEQRETSPTGRLSAVREGQTLRIELMPCRSRLQNVWQHVWLVTSMALYLGWILIFWLILMSTQIPSGQPMILDPWYCCCVLGYGLAYLYVLPLMARRLGDYARESLSLSLDPEGLTLVRTAPEPLALRLPRQAIRSVNAWSGEMGVLTWYAGVSLSLEAEQLDPALRKLTVLNGTYGNLLDIAVGLGRRDRHWLITRLRQDLHQGRQAMLAANTAEPACSTKA